MLDDVRDLGALVESVGFAPAFIVGNSFGASITARLAGQQPEAFQGLVAHEPPLFALLADDPDLAPLLETMGADVGAVVRDLEGGDYAAAVERFKAMALAAGEWQELPDQFRKTAIDNAPTFLDETRDPEALNFDLDWIRGFSKPALLTLGEDSPAQYAPVIRKLAGALPASELHTFPGLGHLPHITDPPAYVETVSAFVRKYAA